MRHVVIRAEFASLHDQQPAANRSPIRAACLARQSFGLTVNHRLLATRSFRRVFAPFFVLLSPFYDAICLLRGLSPRLLSDDVWLKLTVWRFRLPSKNRAVQSCQT